MSKPFKATGWLVVRAKRSNWSTYKPPHPNAGESTIEGARIVKLTATKPTVTAEEIAFQVEIELDEDWFLDATPKITVALPRPVIDTPAVTVSAKPVRGRKQSSAVSVIKNTGTP